MRWKPHLFFLSCALYRSSPGLYSPASSPMWRWWLGLCFTRPVTLPCCGAASLSRPAPWSEPSPCSLWSTSTTCSPGLKNAWITAVSRSEICTVFYEFCFLQTQLPFTGDKENCFNPVLGFHSWAKQQICILGLIIHATKEASSPDSEASEPVRVKTFPPDNGSIVLLHIGQGDVKCSKTTSALWYFITNLRR